jgi:hypothetical protein
MKMRIVLMSALELLAISALAQDIQLADFVKDGGSAVKDPDAPVSFQLPKAGNCPAGRGGATTRRLCD